MHEEPKISSFILKTTVDFNAEKQSGGEAEKESSSESHNFAIVCCNQSNLSKREAHAD
jgi:hypothetical protein